MDLSGNSVAPTVAPEPAAVPTNVDVSGSSVAPEPAAVPTNVDVSGSSVAPTVAIAAPEPPVVPSSVDTHLEALFKIITTDSRFLTGVKESVDKIMKDGKVDQYDVPEIVFVISEAINARPSFRITREQLPALIKMLYNFIVDTYKLVPEEKKAEIERLVDSSVRLLMLQPLVKEGLTRCFAFLSCC
jgi:hypothetical protein